MLAAIEGFGDVHEYAQFQRSALVQRFARVALVTGAAFAFMTFGLQWLGDGPARPSFSIVRGLFFGPAFAAWLVFVHPSRLLPPSSEVEGEDFTVGFSPAMRGLTVVMMVVFAAMGLVAASAAAGFAWVGFFTQGEGLALGACSMWILWICWGSLTQLRVTGHEGSVTHGDCGPEPH